MAGVWASRCYCSIKVSVPRTRNIMLPTMGCCTLCCISCRQAAPVCGFFLPGSDTRSCHWAVPRCTSPWDRSLPGGFLALQRGAALPLCSLRSYGNLLGTEAPQKETRGRKWMDQQNKNNECSEHLCSAFQPRSSVLYRQELSFTISM